MELKPFTSESELDDVVFAGVMLTRTVGQLEDIHSANGGGEVWRTRSKGGELRALPSEHNAIGKESLVVSG